MTDTQHPLGDVLAATNELRLYNLEAVDRLAKYIMAEVDGEPSQGDGACDCAVRILGEQQATIERLEGANSQLWELIQKAPVTWASAKAWCDARDGAKIAREALAESEGDDD